MDDLVRVLDTNRQIERLNQERPAVERELMYVRRDLEETISFFTQVAS